MCQHKRLPSKSDSGVPTLVKFTEDGPNESTFTNTADDSAKPEDCRQYPERDRSFSVEYGNIATSGTEYSTADIVIDAGGQWHSGQEIGITLAERDANTNSLTEEALDVSDPDRMIPTITIGDPHTLTNAGIPHND